MRFTNPVVVPDDGAGAEVTASSRLAELDDKRVAVELTATSGGEKVLSLARAIVALA